MSFQDQKPQNEVSIPSLLGYPEAAEKLGVSVITLRRWVSQGRIPFSKIGSKAVRFTPEQLQSIVTEHPRGGVE